MDEINIKAKMIVKAELLSGNDSKQLKISLPNGSQVVGQSLGIEYEEGENGEEYDVLAFLCPDLGHIFWFKDEEIKDVVLA